MQFNITTDYAVRTVLFLAGRGCLTTAREISEATGIPPSYQLKLTSRLVRAGIVKRMQGRNGGFLLNQDKEDITLFDIMSTMEKTMRVSPCLEQDGSCHFAGQHCPVRAYYQQVQQHLEESLKSVTVASLLAKSPKTYRSERRRGSMEGIERMGI
jgi:Rrf2 family protein